RDVVYRPGRDARIVPAIRAMKREIDRALRAKGAEARNVKLGRGGIREIEFLVQALQLLYAGDDPWLRERNTLKAIFRLTERGYLAPALGRSLSEALVHLRTVEHRLQILHEFQTHTLPAARDALGRLARRGGGERPPRAPTRSGSARSGRAPTGTRPPTSSDGCSPPRVRARGSWSCSRRPPSSSPGSWVCAPAGISSRSS